MLNQSKHSGFTLVEVLVSVIVIAIGLLGIASLQASAIKSTSTASMRSVAAISTQSMVAKMRANTSFWRYDIAEDASNTIFIRPATSGTGYSASGLSLSGNTSIACEVVNGADPEPCSAVDQAKYDLESWMTQAKEVLVNPEATININASGPRDTILIDISWDEQSVGSNSNYSESRRMHYQVGVRI